MIFVFASTYEHAVQDFAHPRGLAPRGREWRYVRDWTNVAGVSSAEQHEVVILPNWTLGQSRQAFHKKAEALEYLRSRGIA